MKNKLITFVLLLTTGLATQAQIKHIFIDINALVATSSVAASKHVGIINSLKYSATVGHTPSKSDLFKALQNAPSLSTQKTYNENLIMPCILSDWLLGLQSNNAIKAIIYQHLQKSNLSDIEKTVFKNIISMMMNPSHLVETQYVIKDLTKILHSLKKNGYTVYIIGNWDKESEGLLMKLLNGNYLPDQRHCYLSNKAKQLKPHEGYFEQLLKVFNLNKQECLIIDIEKNHAQESRNQGFTTILLHGQNAHQLKSELARLGIRV